MTLAEIIQLTLKISIGLIVFCLALSAAPGDLSHLIRRPSLLLRSLLAMNVVMPFLAALIAAMLRLGPALELTLLLLAVSPVPPVLPGKQGKAGGNVSYAMGLVVVSALSAIVLVPTLVTLIARLFGLSAHVPMGVIARVVLPSVIAPLLLGTAVRRLAPTLAARWAGPLSKAGSVLLVVAFVPVLLGSWRHLLDAAGGFTIVAIALFVLAGLLVGHFIGGPDPEDRTVLALSTAQRHPAVALAVAGAILPDKQAVAPTVLLAVLVTMIVVAPYMKWRKGAGPERGQ